FDDCSDGRYPLVQKDPEHRKIIAMKNISIFIALLISLAMIACQQNNRSNAKLPVLGRKEVNGGDTIYQTIGDFRFINQDSAIITPATFEDKIYIADFFFTSCPTICPVMKTQMLRVYEEFQDNPEFAILSHTID